MSFLVLLLAIWIEKFSGLRRRIQRDGWWLGKLRQFEGGKRMGSEPWLCLVLLVGVPVAVLVLLLMVLEPVAYGWFGFPLHLLVVIYSLGRGDLLGALGPFRDAWRRTDLEAAALVAERDIGLKGDEPGELLEQVQGHLLWQAYQSFFAVIFWYFLLGPAAALGYRLLALAAENATNPALAERAEQARHVLDFIPVRLLAASFALVGNFAAVTRVMLHELLNLNISATRLISEVGKVAGEVPAPVVGEAGLASLDDLWELLVRAAVLWYSGFAVWTLLV